MNVSGSLKIRGSLFAPAAEQMIREGAKIIFPTSFGYSGPIKEIIDKHPDVMFLHLGDLEIFENYGSFFANIWQLEFATGKAAGHATETGKLSDPDACASKIGVHRPSSSRQPLKNLAPDLSPRAQLWTSGLQNNTFHANI